MIVGGAELGPYGSSRTRFEVEVDNELSAAGVLELAWTTGLVKWEDDPTPGWYDAETGDLVDEGELVERYHDAVIDRVGIREFVDDGAIDPDHAAPLLVSVFLDKDFTFVVSSEADARAFMEFDPEHTVIAPVPDSSDWQVTRKAGTEIRVPRKTKLSRTVGAQVPTGFDPMVYGVSQDMMNSIDRLAIWNLVTTVDAFLSAGFTPEELMRWVHPSLVANTQGTGMGGMTSMQTMYHGNLLGRNKPNDILQEVLPNVSRRHVVQSYIGSYGAMIHPVGACATAAVSRRGRRRQDPARQGRAGDRRRLRRPHARGDHRLRRHGGHRRQRDDAVEGYQRLEVLPRQRPAQARLRRGSGWWHASCWPAATSRSIWACRYSR